MTKKELEEEIKGLKKVTAFLRGNDLKIKELEAGNHILKRQLYENWSPNFDTTNEMYKEALDHNMINANEIRILKNQIRILKNQRNFIIFLNLILVACLYFL